VKITLIRPDTEARRIDAHGMFIERASRRTPLREQQ